MIGIKAQFYCNYRVSVRCGLAVTKSFIPWSPKLRVTAKIPKTLLFEGYVQIRYGCNIDTDVT